MHLRKFIIIILALTSQAAFSQSNSLEQELEQLKTQIEQLTQRLDRLEQKKYAPSPAIAEATPWQHLKIGFPSWKVEKYLGKPISKTKGSIEYWFYSDEKKNGPMVKFVLGTVHSWREPQH